MTLMEETSSTTAPTENENQGGAPTAHSTDAPNHHGVTKLGAPGLLIAGVVLATVLGCSTQLATSRSLLAYTGRRRDEVTAESGTAEVECDPDLIEEARILFDQGNSEFFQDGMNSSFSKKLLTFLGMHGFEGFRAIATYVTSGLGRSDVTSESLRWLAEYCGVPIEERWKVLEHSLSDRSPRVRDGAILGFALLDDPRARSLLTAARSEEQIAELRLLIDAVVQQLDRTDATLHGASPANS